MIIGSKIYGSFEAKLLMKKFPAEYSEFIGLDHNVINHAYYKPIEPKMVIDEGIKLEEIYDKHDITAAELVELSKKHDVPFDRLRLSVYCDSNGDYTMTIYSNKSGPDPKYTEKLKQYLIQVAIYEKSTENKNKIIARSAELTQLFDSTLKAVMDGLL